MLNMLSYLTQGGTLARFALLVLVLRLPIVCISLSTHESAHGYAAYRLGDPTARSLGRISLNPLKHFDLFGTLSMIFLGIGWAKPVPINSRYFKNPKRDFALTAAAGPISNLLLAFIGMLVLRVLDIVLFDGTYYATLPGTPYSLADYAPTLMLESDIALSDKLLLVLMFFFEMFGMLNLSLAIFNLIPIPPFDGSRIAFALLPDRYYFGIMRYERIIMLVFIFLFYQFGGGFSTLVGWIYDGIYGLLTLATSFI